MATIYKKKCTYVPPTPPVDLIDCSHFILDFTSRKFLNVGLDPTDEFNTVVQIITPSRYINVSAEFLKRIFSLMGNILSFILVLPQKYKRNLFLETEIISLASMVYRGENMLVIVSKTQDGCRILLNRTDLIRLQYLEWSIHETVVRKSAIIRPAVLKQFEIIGDYIDRKFTKVEKPSKTNEEMMIFIKNLRNDLITTNPDLNFVSQPKMFAISQLAEQWAQRWSGEMSPELFTESEMRLISPPRYSSLSPMHDEDDFSQSRPVPSSLPTTNTLPDYDSDNFAQDPYGCIKSFRYIDPSSVAYPEGG
ncbi:hypothetical protein QTP88_000791 [Uroleucon formosanum]